MEILQARFKPFILFLITQPYLVVLLKQKKA